jgi:hypothetical protein
MILTCVDIDLIDLLRLMVDTIDLNDLHSMVVYGKIVVGLTGHVNQAESISERIFEFAILTL